MALDGPFYRGVVNLTESTMTLRIVARCSEANRAALERNLTREMRLLLTRHNIAPYQLQFEHEDDVKPDKAKEAEEARELKEADSFVESQDESLSKLEGEDKE